MAPPKDTLTRKEVAGLFAVSVRSVLRMDDRGELHPQQDHEGNVTYARAEVEALLKARGRKPARPGSRGAQSPLADRTLYSMMLRDLRNGRAPLDIVIDYQLTGQEAEALLAGFEKFADAIVLQGADRKRVRELLPKVTNGAGIRQALEFLSKKYHEFDQFAFKCARCGKAAQADPSHWLHLAKQGSFDGWRHHECYGDGGGNR